MVEISIQKPNPKQIKFFIATERFVAYGGARGGGKSWSVRRKALLLGVTYSGIKMLLLRRTFPELRENHILPLLSELKGIAEYKEVEKSFTFANGSRIKLGYCDNDGDVLQYQGQEFDIIFIDEATQFTEYQFSTLTACLRGVNNFPKRMYLTCNPGGIGHAWVKRLFIDKKYNRNENPEDYLFIPARVYDNKALLETDKGYVSMLEALPDGLRQAWLDGNWDVFEGQYFSMWDRNVHVIKPFPLPETWRRYVTMDYGRDMFACYFITVDEQGKGYVYKEIYESDLIVSQAIERLKSITNERIDGYFAPGDLWNKHSDTGKSTADIFAENGIGLIKANNNRVQGWYDVAEWLKVTQDEQGQNTARLRIFENCYNLIRTLPMLQYDAKNTNDVSREPHELTHAPDAIRYFCAGRPLSATKPTVKDFDITEYDDQVDDFLSFANNF